MKYLFVLTRSLLPYPIIVVIMVLLILSYFERNNGMNANLILLRKSGEDKPFPLPGGVTIIGRRQECDLCVPLMVVSRKHCEINQDKGILRIRDLGSSNGTFINGEKITEAVLNPGDKVKIGTVSFGIQIDGVPSELTASDSAVLTPPADVPETAQDDEDPLFEVDIDEDVEETFENGDIMEMIDGLGDGIGEDSSLD